MPMIRYLLVIWIFIISNIYLLGQGFHMRAHLGAMYYQGDLAPRPIDFSFGPGNMSFGLSAGLDIKDWGNINTRFTRGKLSGSDAYADNPGRKQRNLSFESPLYEYGLYVDFNVNKLWRGLDKYNLRLYISGGINYIHFDPRAYYDGQWIRLQPLGTEGQNIKSSGKQPYSLFSWSRPISLKAEFDLSKRLAVGLEFSPTKTYTDYLDDVSGTYVNYHELVASGNILGAALANRQGEYLGTGPVSVPTGSPRGQADKNDWYTLWGVYWKYKFGKIKYGRSFHVPDDSLPKEEVYQSSQK